MIPTGAFGEIYLVVEAHNDKSKLSAGRVRCNEDRLQKATTNQIEVLEESAQLRPDRRATPELAAVAAAPIAIVTSRRRALL